MWKARTKTDLAIEVWEKLDCEDVGAAEIEAIETVIRDQYGEHAIDSPMKIARLLADEGAALRHAEIMELHLARVLNRPYEAVLRDILDISDLRPALTSIRDLEGIRKRYLADNDREGARIVRETALHAKDRMIEMSERSRVDAATRRMNAEIAEWLTVWLQTPDVFEDWVSLRQRSRDFIERFGRIRYEDE